MMEVNSNRKQISMVPGSEQPLL